MINNKEIYFEIPGEPVSKARPRVTKHGTYTPEKTVNYENWVKLCFRESKEDKLQGALLASITCYFSIPNSFSNKKKNDAITGVLRPTKKPDIDNIAKIIFDSLNKLAFDDDKQIVSCTIQKLYASMDNPRIEVHIAEIT